MRRRSMLSCSIGVVFIATASAGCGDDAERPRPAVEVDATPDASTSDDTSTPDDISPPDDTSPPDAFSLSEARRQNFCHVV